MDRVLERLAQVRAVSFRHVSAQQRQVGILAQDVEEAFPELVVQSGAGEPKGVDYAGLAGVLVGAVQELRAAVAALAARVEQADADIRVDVRRVHEQPAVAAE